MTTDEIRALVAAKFPGILDSPLAHAMHCASSMAMLEASDANDVIERAAVLADARAHADACIQARTNWTVETLGHNIESAFGMDLDADECDEIARQALVGRVSDK